jgi:aldose 1-epimerase
MSLPQFIELELERQQGGQVKAVISTMGAALKRVCVNGSDIITPTSGHELNPYADGYVMAPWANRIDRGVWQHEGQTLQLKINDVELDNAIHGLVTSNIFEVDSRSLSEVTLKTKVQAETGYPFELEVLISYQLTENGIAVRQSIQNLSENPAPVAFGSHPYFQIPGTATEDLEFKSAARTVDLVNDRKIPIGKQKIAGTDFDISEWRKLSTCNFDHGFSDLERDASGAAHHYLLSPHGETLDIWQSSEFKYAFIFTPDFFINNADQTPRSAITIEPQTGPANAFNSKEDLIWLEPGQVSSASWGVEFTTKPTES